MHQGISESDVYMWKQHPVSQHFYKLIGELERQYTLVLKDGVLLDGNNTGEKYARVVGFLEAIRTIVDAELATKEETQENEQINSDAM